MLCQPFGVKEFWRSLTRFSVFTILCCLQNSFWSSLRKSHFISNICTECWLLTGFNKILWHDTLSLYLIPNCPVSILRKGNPDGCLAKDARVLVMYWLLLLDVSTEHVEKWSNRLNPPQWYNVRIIHMIIAALRHRLVLYLSQCLLFNFWEVGHLHIIPKAVGKPDYSREHTRALSDVAQHAFDKVDR